MENFFIYAGVFAFITGSAVYLEAYSTYQKGRLIGQGALALLLIGGLVQTFYGDGAETFRFWTGATVGLIVGGLVGEAPDWYYTYLYRRRQRRAGYIPGAGNSEPVPLSRGAPAGLAAPTSKRRRFNWQKGYIRLWVVGAGFWAIYIFVAAADAASGRNSPHLALVALWFLLPPAAAALPFVVPAGWRWVREGFMDTDNQHAP